MTAAPTPPIPLGVRGKRDRYQLYRTTPLPE
jgi:hypothetical protein